jgi:nucleotide-binding universal stress UspA family protein
MFDKVLVAIDDSELSSNFFEQAIEFAKANKSEMMLIHNLKMKLSETMSRLQQLS